mgnify:CR=1 FL=1
MITTLKTNDRYIFAYIMWDTVDKDGQKDPNGEYLFIYDLWIHVSHRGQGALNELIGMIDANPASKSAKWVYWEREKYGDRMSKLINRFSIAKKGVHYVVG